MPEIQSVKIFPGRASTLRPDGRGALHPCRLFAAPGNECQGTASSRRDPRLDVGAAISLEE